MNIQALRRHSDPSHHHDNNILLEVDFKWLMAGIGYWIDFVKLRNDPVYANNCLQCALKSDCEPLRRCALEIRDELDNAQ